MPLPLSITLSVLLLLLLLLCIRVRVVLSYRTEVRAELRILFLRFTLYPKKEKRIKVSDYTYRRYRKRILAQRKRLTAKRGSKEKHTYRARQKKPALKDQLTFYFSLVAALYERFLHHFRIDVSRLHVTVATGDAASTAIATGAVSGLLSCILELISHHTNLHRAWRSDIAVVPDFLSESSRADCCIVFSLRVFAILELGIRFAYHFLTKSLKKTAHDA